MEPETPEQEQERYELAVSQLALVGFTPIGDRRRWRFVKNDTVYDLSAANLDQIDRIEREGLCIVGKMRAWEEVSFLKHDWSGDPTWDIEHTEGFEAHHDELLQFRIETEARWDRERTERLEALAEALGCPGNLTLAAYVKRLERRLEILENHRG